LIFIFYTIHINIYININILGLTDPKEDIHIAAEREVFEETGIHTKFQKILCFRQSHFALFGKSDLFFICLLELDDHYYHHHHHRHSHSHSIEEPVITIQETEIHCAAWKEIECLINQSFYQQSQLWVTIHQLIGQEVAARQSKNNNNNNNSGLIVEKSPIGFRPGEHSLYYIKDHDNNNNNKE
jgi:hypothetical protein